MPNTKVALLAGLALLATATALTLSQSPLSVARATRTPGATEEPIAATTHGATYCQAHETLPRDTSAIRIWLDASAGPAVSVVVSSGGRPVTSGVRGSDWIGGSVTVAVRPLERDVGDATLCVSFSLRDETLIVQGSAAPAAIAAHDGRRALAGRMWIEYLRPGTRSWASLAPEILRHMGFGRAGAGTWLVYIALLLLAGVLALASSLILRELP